MISNILRVVICLTLLMGISAIVGKGEAYAQTVVLQVDGEGYADGEPIPGWNMTFWDPAASATSVTASTDSAAIHSGSRGVKINGDYLRGKNLDYVAKGIVTIDYWHYDPTPGINSAFKLIGGSPGIRGVDCWDFVTVLNTGGQWWVGADGGLSYAAPYTGSYTHIVITINTTTGLFDLSIDGQLVRQQATVDNADKIGTWGIGYVFVHSGWAGGGTDSYFDALVITATAAPTPNTPVGSPVAVDLGNVQVTFDTVTGNGTTAVTTSTENLCGATPEGYQVIGLYTDVTTTATYIGLITVGIRYDDYGIPDENDLRLFTARGLSGLMSQGL